MILKSYSHTTTTTTTTTTTDYDSIDYKQLNKIDLSSDILSVYIDDYFDYINEHKKLFIEYFQFLSNGNFILFTTIGYYVQVILLFDNKLKVKNKIKISFKIVRRKF